jgi:hypothetical protein
VDLARAASRGPGKVRMTLGRIATA